VLKHEGLTNPLHKSAPLKSMTPVLQGVALSRMALSADKADKSATAAHVSRAYWDSLSSEGRSIEMKWPAKVWERNRNSRPRQR